MRVLLRDRDARLFIVGGLVSTLGDSALWLAMGIWVKLLTGSTSAAGLSIFALTLGTMLGPVSGMLVDRVRRRPLMIVTNLATAILVLPLLLVHDRHMIWLIYLVMFGYGLSASVLGPAQSALMQTIVPQDLLGDANSVTQTLNQGLRLITPLLGAGLLAAFGPAPVVIGDAATFLVAIAALLAIRVEEPRPEPSGQHLFGEMAAGVRHIATTAVLRQLVVAGVLVIIGFGLSETVCFAIVTDGLHRPATFLGVLIPAQGLGAIVGGVSAAALMRRVGEGHLVGFGATVIALGFALLVFSWLPPVFVGFALCGVSLPWIIVGLSTLFQRRTPPALMGRTSAALGLALSVPQTLAIALGAGLVAIVDYRILLAGMAALLAAAAVYLFTRVEQRHGPGPTSIEESPPSAAALAPPLAAET